MTLGNMRELGVQHLIVFCLNDACRHQALIERVELSGRDRGAVPGEVQQVRRPRQQDRRATELQKSSRCCPRSCAMIDVSFRESSGSA